MPPVIPGRGERCRQSIGNVPGQEPRLEIRVGGGRLVAHGVAGLDPVDIDPQGEKSGHVAPAARPDVPDALSPDARPNRERVFNGNRADTPAEAAS